MDLHFLVPVHHNPDARLGPCEIAGFVGAGGANPRLTSYSVLSTCMGWIEAARRAGK
jgi:hypothetical protein